MVQEKDSISVSAKKRSALFLDRDGVICEAMPDGEYLLSWEKFRPLDGIFELVGDAKEKGYLIIVATNQGGPVARGLLTERDIIGLHDKMQTLFNGAFNAIYYCPHYHADNCDCRKPKPGMLKRAAKDFNIDFRASYFLGDTDKDILAGAAVGMKTIFLKSEHQTHTLEHCSPDFVVNTLYDATTILK